MCMVYYISANFSIRVALIDKRVIAHVFVFGWKRAYVLTLNSHILVKISLTCTHTCV